MNLIDVPCVENLFTWFSGDGRSMNRLDIFLLSEPLVELWGVMGQVTSKRDILDHFSICLKVDKVDWDPKPFKVNNCLFENKEFKDFVKKE
ncbi:unnamed protein product [Lathyrus sativus]|nr:unnamed protein product [Lathyrus sativus]